MVHRRKTKIQEIDILALLRRTNTLAKKRKPHYQRLITLTERLP